jgi:lysophospholipase L1-like esterase
MIFKNNSPNKAVSILGDSISIYSHYNAVEFTVLKSDVSTEIKGYPTFFDVGVSLGGKMVTVDMIGKEIDFSPGKSDVGKCIGMPREVRELQYKQVWWSIVVKKLQLRLLQNVSWVGSRICTEDVDIYKTAQAWHPAQIAKLSKRDKNGRRFFPDIIIIFRGINDFSHKPFSEITEYDPVIDATPLNDNLSSGTCGFKEGYCLTVDKCRESYPKAKIVLCTLYYVKRLNCGAGFVSNGINTLNDYNSAIREIAGKLNCHIIEFDKLSLEYTTIDNYTIDGTHPNVKGHKLLAERAIKDLLPVLEDK